MKKNNEDFRQALKELEKRGVVVTIAEAGHYSLREKGSGVVIQDALPKEKILRFSLLAKLEEFNPFKGKKEAMNE